MNPHSRLALVANIGAEEAHRTHEQLLRHPASKLLARLWLNLFDERENLLVSPEPNAQSQPWLQAPAGPGLLPWLSTLKTESMARKQNLPHLGPSAASVKLSHDKAFAHEVALSLGRTSGWEFSKLLDANLRHSSSRQVLQNTLDDWPQWARDNFTIKPRMGSSGRGRIAGKGGVIAKQHVQGLERMCSRGGAIVEPWYRVEDNLSTQLYIHPNGEHSVIGHTQQVLSRAGSYLGSCGTWEDGRSNSGTSLDNELSHIANGLAPMAAAKHFHGTLGFDAFTFHCPETNQIKLRAPLEINARFTCGMVGLHYVNRLSKISHFENGCWLFVLDAPEDFVSQALAERSWHVQLLDSADTPLRPCVMLSTRADNLTLWQSVLRA